MPPHFQPRGIYVPHVTPFTPDGALDDEGLRALVRFWLEAGVHGLAPCGSNGEAPYMTRAERKAVIEQVVETTARRIDVIAGTGSVSTAETVGFSKDAQDVGADALLVVTPYYFKPSRSELLDHYREVVKNVDLPVMLYNVPKFTGFNLEPSIVAELAKEERIMGVKDSGGDLGQIAETIRLTRWRDDFSVMAGTGNLIFPTLMLGGKGAIVAVANAFPRECVGIYENWRKGQMTEARDLQLSILEANRLLTSKYGVVAVKEALNLQGLPGGYPRKPLRPLPAEAREEIARLLPHAAKAQ